MNIRERVIESLNNAVENGYEDAIRAMTNEQIADDLLSLDAELEDLTQADIMPFVVEWSGKQ